MNERKLRDFSFAIISVTIVLTFLGCGRIEEALDQEEMKEYKDLIEASGLEVEEGDTQEADPGCNRPGGGRVIAYYDAFGNKIVINEDYFDDKSIEELKEVIVHEVQHHKNRQDGVTDDFEDEYLARKAECDLWREVKKEGQTGLSDSACEQVYLPDGSERPREEVKRLLEDLCYTFEEDRREERRREWREWEIASVVAPNVGFSFDYPNIWLLRGQEVVNEEISAIGYVLEGHDEGSTGRGKTTVALRVEPASINGGRYNSLEEYITATRENRRFSDSNLLLDQTDEISGKRAHELAYEFTQERPPRTTDAVPIKVVWQWSVTLQNEYFYEVLLSTSRNDYETDVRAYEFIKSSIQFLEVDSINQYASWSSRKPAINFLYPISWSITRWYDIEDIEGGTGLRIIGPRESESRVGETSFYIYVLPTSSLGQEMTDIVEYSNISVSNRSFGETEELFNRKIEFLGQAARNIALRFTTDRPAYTVNPVSILTVWEWIVFQQNEQLYEIFFIASEADRDEASQLFSEFRDSFTLR